MGFLLPLSSMFFLRFSWISSSLEDHWCFRRPTLCSRSASNSIFWSCISQTCQGKQYFVVMLKLLLAMVVADHTSHLQKRCRRQLSAIHGWLSSAVTTVNLWSLMLWLLRQHRGWICLSHATEISKISEECLNKYIDVTFHLHVLRIVPDGSFHELVSFAAISRCEGLSLNQGPCHQTELETDPQVTGGGTPQTTRSHQPVLKCGLRNAAPLPDVSHPASWTLTYGHHGDWVKNDLGKSIFLPPLFIYCHFQIPASHPSPSPGVTCTPRIQQLTEDKVCLFYPKLQSPRRNFHCTHLKKKKKCMTVQEKSLLKWERDWCLDLVFPSFPNKCSINKVPRWTGIGI